MQLLAEIATQKTEIPLTDRQMTVLNHLYASIRKDGRQPTVREYMPVLGIYSPNGVMCHIHALIKKGYLARDHAKSRGYTLLRRPDGTPFRGFVEVS